MHIHRKSITWDEDSMKFRLYCWKTQGASSTQYLNFFVIHKIEDPKICAYLALKGYITICKEDYKSVNCDSIWLDYQGKHLVKSVTLVNCAKRLMEEAGIDKLFGSGTIKHTAITLWRNRDILLDQVIN